MTDASLFVVLYKIGLHFLAMYLAYETSYWALERWLGPASRVAETGGGR